MKQIFQVLLIVLEWGILGFLAWVGYCLDFESDTIHNKLVRLFVIWTKNQSVYLVFGLPVVLCLIRFVKWSIKPKSNEQQILDRLLTEALDKFREACFPNLAENARVDFNRVTIFKHKKVKWWFWPFRNFYNPCGGLRHPWSGWLAVLNRSGHVTQTATTVFLAPDDASNAEGVAGQAWRSRAALRVGAGDSRLPNLNEGDCYYSVFLQYYFGLRYKLGHQSHKVLAFAEVRLKICQYAELTHTSVNFVWRRLKARKLCPTSILGVQILDHNKEPWGVLVMDSSNETECIDTTEIRFKSELTTLQNKLQSLGVFEK